MKKNQGFTLVEVMVAVLILSTILVTIINIHYFMSKQGVRAKDQAFATQKAIQIMEELRSLVAGAEKTNISVLDYYRDGTSYNTKLTIESQLNADSDPPSDNVKIGDNWKFLRQITIDPLPNEPFARKVYVRIYRSSNADPTQPSETLAETVSILKTITSQFVPTCVLDTYILCLENVPGWWTTLPQMRSSFDSVIEDIKTRNPGLEIRTHWITRTAYGRDPEYTPYINYASVSDASVIPWVYLYPGLTHSTPTDTGQVLYYDPEIIGGRINVDGTIQNVGTYSICDRFNHAVRYPEEKELYDQEVDNAQAMDQAAPEMSYRMLLEKMNSDPTSLKNIMLINLHGELLPLPSMRNYSDAAKDPVNYRRIRVVAHPEQLKYASGATAYVKFRVYTYVTEPNLYKPTATLTTATLYFPDTNINANDITVYKITGSTATNDDYRMNLIPGPAAGPGWSLGTTYYIDHPTGSDTRILLYNNPVRCSTNTFSSRGLPAAKRLYGMEYIPCPISTGTAAFERDLTYNSNTVAKNTARWIIAIATGTLPNCANSDSPYILETYIGSYDPVSGQVDGVARTPANQSRTYVWVGADPPFTEQYQLMGDPRHMPYKDVKEKHYYNWYFRDIDASTDYLLFNKASSNGWNGGGGDVVDIDTPRFFQMVRGGLLKTEGIWSAMNGWCYYYYGMGGEFGSDMSPFEDGIPFLRNPWSSSGNSDDIEVDEILPSNSGVEELLCRVVAKSDSSNWYAKYWLGELYPDSDYPDWQAFGNLPTNPTGSSGNFYRAQYDTFSDLSYDRSSRTHSGGCSTFFNGQPVGGTGPYNHASGDYTGNLTALGLRVANGFNFPLLSTIDLKRPFTLNKNANFPPEWSDNQYAIQRTTISIPAISGTDRIYYDSSYTAATYRGSAVVKLTSGTTNGCYIVPSGLYIQGQVGAVQLGKFNLLSMLRAFLDGGLQASPGVISQVPLVDLSKPSVADTFNNPAVIDVEWNHQWERWDGQKYTEEYTTGYVDPESANIRYSLKYTKDNGRHWYYCSDNTATKAGKKDLAHTIVPAATPPTTYTWNVSNTTTYPRGSYILRVECYRVNIDLHYSYDQIGVYINR